MAKKLFGKYLPYITENNIKLERYINFHPLCFNRVIKREKVTNG